MFLLSTIKPHSILEKKLFALTTYQYFLPWHFLLTVWASLEFSSINYFVVLFNKSKQRTYSWGYALCLRWHQMPLLVELTELPEVVRTIDSKPLDVSEILDHTWNGPSEQVTPVTASLGVTWCFPRKCGKSQYVFSTSVAVHVNTFLIE